MQKLQRIEKYYFQKLLQKNIADERLRESVAMATGAVLHTYCLEEEACKSEVSCNLFPLKPLKHLLSTEIEK